MGGIPGLTWNLVTISGLATVVDSQGAATDVAVDLGKGAAGQQSIDWSADGFGVIASGSAQTTGVYAGNARSALFVNDGKESNVDLGIRVSGLSRGVYDAFLTAKNTNTAVDEAYRVYATVVDGSAAATDYSTVEPALMEHGLDAAWRFGETFTAHTFEIRDDEDLVLVVEGVTPGELRGFINTLEILKLSGVLTADVNGDDVVDLSDFTMIRQNFLTNVGVGADGDANSDGMVDFGDYFFWRRVYLEQGGDVNAIPSFSVPEPRAAAGLLVLGLLLPRSRVLAMRGMRWHAQGPPRGVVRRDLPRPAADLRPCHPATATH